MLCFCVCVCVCVCLSLPFPLPSLCSGVRACARVHVYVRRTDPELTFFFVSYFIIANIVLLNVVIAVMRGLRFRA